MLTTHDIPQSPLIVIVHGSDGGAHTVTVAPREAGRVAISCSCASFARDGWCHHLVDLCCMRLRDCGVTDPETDERFEEIVAGTPLESSAHDVDMSLAAYDLATTKLTIAQQSAQPANFTRDALETVASASRDVAEAAETASDAIKRFQRNIAKGRI
jgi:hypothetical protein